MFGHDTLPSAKLPATISTWDSSLIGRLRRTPHWLYLARRLLPNIVWSGAGLIVRKRSFDSAVVSWTLIDVNPVRVTGVVPARWVLVVQDAAGKERFGVDTVVWDSYEVGDVVTADNLLINIP